VEVWDLDAGFVSTLENSAGMVFLDFSPSDTLIAGSTSTGQIRVWDTATGEMLFHAAATGERFAWAPDEAALVTGCAPSALCLWDVSSGELIWKTPDTSRFGIVSVLEFNSDGTLLASSASGTTGVIVDVLTGIVLAQLDQGVASSALEFSWSSDGTRLASISRDGYLRLWGVPADIEVPDLTLNDGGRAVVNDTPSVRAASLIADNTSGTEGWAVESADGIQTLIPLADN
jgi:WD40 repeat protein